MHELILHSLSKSNVDKNNWRFQNFCFCYSYHKHMHLFSSRFSVSMLPLWILKTCKIIRFLWLLHLVKKFNLKYLQKPFIDLILCGIFFEKGFKGSFLWYLYSFSSFWGKKDGKQIKVENFSRKYLEISVFIAIHILSIQTLLKYNSSFQ